MERIILKSLSHPLSETWEPINYSEVLELKAEDYQRRIDRLWAMPQAKDYSCIIVYADREHYSNLHYFTGFDVRFEESLLVLIQNHEPILILGNEAMNHSRIIPLKVKRIMYQTFSLMGQPNDERSLPLHGIISTLPIPQKGDIGLIGWKQYDSRRHRGLPFVSDLPHYIVQELLVALDAHRIKNATDLLMDCTYGLKHNIDEKDIVIFETRATKCSRGVYSCISRLSEGLSECEASELFRLDGEPMTTHPNVNFGDINTSYGLCSPNYYSRLHLGDFIAVGYGLRGAFSHRSGVYASNENDLPDDRKDHLEKMLKPYFMTIAKWYEMMSIGTSCGQIWQMVENKLGCKKFGIGLNPGHLTYTDEWTNSPFYEDSEVRVSSGMYIQCDFTVTFDKPYMTCHIEDGIVIADDLLRKKIKTLSEQCWNRIIKRQHFMRSELGIQIPDEVLPLSDIPAVCFPYMADTQTVLAKEID